MIVISHQFAGIEEFDQIPGAQEWPDNRAGTHTQLIALKGYYHDLFYLPAPAYRQ
ncbi:MAG: hypothetical protein IPJ07_17180 [Acidobacteria bacterium]|nr:hypothetical protein [Acidobacteriota bacterium]